MPNNQISDGIEKFRIQKFRIFPSIHQILAASSYHDSTGCFESDSDPPFHCNMGKYLFSQLGTNQISKTNE